MALALISSPPCFRECVKGAISATTSTEMSSLERILSLANLTPFSVNHLKKIQIINLTGINKCIHATITSSSSSSGSTAGKDLPSRQDYSECWNLYLKFHVHKQLLTLIRIQVFELMMELSQITSTIVATCRCWTISSLRRRSVLLLATLELTIDLVTLVRLNINPSRPPSFLPHCLVMLLISGGRVALKSIICLVAGLSMRIFSICSLKFGVKSSSASSKMISSIFPKVCRREEVCNVVRSDEENVV